MKIFHIKAADYSTEMKNRFADLVCAFASIGINQQVLMTADEALESHFTDMDIPFHIQKFSGMFDLRTQQTAQQIAESFGPHVIHTHTPDSANVISKLNYEALRIAFLHDDEKSNAKIKAHHNIVITLEYTPFGSPLDYNVLTVPPLVYSPGPDITPVSRSTYDTPDDVPLIVTMADLIDEYDYKTILAALREIPEVRYWIIGSGSEKQTLVDKAHKQGVSDRVTFIEDDTNWPGLLKAADLCVIPKRSNSVDRLTLEAWSCGVPVLSAMGEESSPISHDETGWLVPANDILKWREALKQHLADEESRQKTAKAGHEKYQQSYAYERIVPRYLQCYETALRVAV